MRLRRQICFTCWFISVTTPYRLIDSVEVKFLVFYTLVLSVVTDCLHTSAVPSPNKISMVTGRWLSGSYINIDYHFNDARYCNMFLRWCHCWARSQNCEKRLSASSCVCVRLSVCSHRTDFNENWLFEIFLEKSVEKIRVYLRLDKNNGCVTWRPMCMYDNISLNSS